MHHLQHPVVEFRSTRYVADLAFREQIFQIVATWIEVRQRDVAGVVACIYTVWRARTSWRARSMLSDSDFDSHDLTRLYVPKFRPGTAIDHARRQMKQHIDDTRRLAVEEPGIELPQLGPNAGQAGERREQGVEQGWPHKVIIAKFSVSCPASGQASTPSFS